MGEFQVTKKIPRDELYGVISQLRRAALSIMLNYIEGYARFKTGTKLQFYETGYGSLKESKYLVYFSFTENYLPQDDHNKLIEMADEIGKMLWREMEPLR